MQTFRQTQPLIRSRHQDWLHGRSISVKRQRFIGRSHVNFLCIWITIRASIEIEQILNFQNYNKSMDHDFQGNSNGSA